MHQNIVSLQFSFLVAVHAYLLLPCLPACLRPLLARCLVQSQQSLVSQLLCSLVAIVPYTLQTMALTFGAFVALLLFVSFLVSHSACLLHLLVCHTVHLYMQLIRQDS